MILDKGGNPYKFYNGMGNGYTSYDAVNNKGKRKQSQLLLRDEDNELLPIHRRQLVANSRELYRNFAIFAWMVRKHVEHVSSFIFQARTGDNEFDNEIEQFMQWWSLPENCDAAGRHSLAKMTALAEERRTVDGDIFLLKLRNGSLQAIEGDRIRSEGVNLPEGFEATDFVHGVVTNRFGAAAAYVICSRTPYGMFEFERLVKADYIYQHGFFSRFDQVRGISPLTSAMNSLRDVYEAFDYALARAKISQLFALVFKRDLPDDLGTVTGDGQNGYTVDFSGGSQILDMEPGDSVDWLESKTPATEFQNFCEMQIRVALKALDLPYVSFDENSATFSGGRFALQQYEISADRKRHEVRQMLNHITQWRLALAVADGTLILPKGKTINDIKWEWISTVGLSWLNPLQDVNADLQALSAGLTSRQQICKEQGKDFYEVAKQIANENKYLVELGIPTTVNPSNITIQQISGEDNSNG
jgi:lambda family phage portal protein